MLKVFLHAKRLPCSSAGLNPRLVRSPTIAKQILLQLLSFYVILQGDDMVL